LIITPTSICVSFVIVASDKESFFLVSIQREPPSWSAMISGGNLLLQPGKPYMINDKVNTMANVMVTHNYTLETNLLPALFLSSVI
jgi:hypothetical protein